MSKYPTPVWHMRRALRLAEKGKGFVLPNPMVGAVIVKNGVRIGEGYHKEYGGDHAEVSAIKNSTESIEGATLYVTLEPCDHIGNTPPCTDAIIKSGIKKVVIAAKDPSRNGIGKLIDAGIEVETGILEEQARSLNKEFFTYHEKQRPYITLKFAMSLDGKIAEAPKTRTHLTGSLSQKLTHVMRHEHQAILVGAGTVLGDNPHLGVRHIEGRDPHRIIWKGKKELPTNSKIFRDSNVSQYEANSTKEIINRAHKEGIQSMLVEGGSKVITQFIESKVWDEMQIFCSPQILGTKGLPFFQAESHHSLKIKNVRQCGPDILISITPQWDLKHT